VEAVAAPGARPDAFGYTGIARRAAQISKILFFIFLILFIVILILVITAGQFIF
jgi:uncharacterized membrane protein YtjA (UPF0391 family)